MIADLHLSFGVPNKKMDLFGPEWENHPEKIAQDWKQKVSESDLVLIPGDISWAMSAEEVMPDLEWIHALPGKKLMIRGNHDYWWSSASKVRKLLPESIEVIQNSVYRFENVEIGGARLWDTPEFSFGPPLAGGVDQEKLLKDEKIFERELGRLELSLQQFGEYAEKRIVMTHYPPIGNDLKSTRAHELLKKYRVDLCVFGHLHGFQRGVLPFGTLDGIHYLLTSCDYTGFKLLSL